MTDSKIYRHLKCFWLLSQGLMLPFAAVYAANAFEQSNLFLFLPGLFQEAGKFLLLLGGVLTLVFWLIFQSLLSIYRFPLKTSQALSLVCSFLLQYLVLLLTGGSVFFAAFISVCVTLFALLICVALLLLTAFREDAPRLKSHRQALAALILVIALFLLPTGVLVPLILQGYDSLNLWAQLFSLAAIAGNVLNTVHLLVSFSIWGKPDIDHDARFKEWEAWAAPTIIVLIVSAISAAVIAGIMH